MIYADTNFFTNLWVEMSHSAEARRLSDGIESPLPVTWLLKLEIVNALQQCVFLSRRGGLGVRLTSEHASVLEWEFYEQAREGTLFRLCQVDGAGIELLFLDLSHRHTAKEGFRAYDILHVAQALVLGCDTFWSFDDKARKLAKLEGLKVN